MCPIQSCSLSSLHPFRHRHIKWRLAHREAVSTIWPLTSDCQAGLEDEVRTWKVSAAAASHALCPEGAALQTRWPSDLSLSRRSQTLTGQTAKASRNPHRPQSPVHPDPHSRLFVLNWPGVNWSYLTPGLWVKSFFSLQVPPESYTNPSMFKICNSMLIWLYFLTFLIKPLSVKKRRSILKCANLRSPNITVFCNITGKQEGKLQFYCSN